MRKNIKHAVPVAVIGVGSVFPNSLNADIFWKNIVQSQDLLQEIPETHWLIKDYYDPDPKARDKTYCKRGGFVPDVPFDTIEYGVPPNILSATDTAQLISLVVAKQALSDAFGEEFASQDLSNASVILGATGAQELLATMSAKLSRPVWENAARAQGMSDAQVSALCERIQSSYVEWQEATFPGLLGNVIAGRIANRFNFGGTNCVIDAACASSLSALTMSLYELQLGYSDVVLCGGVDTLNDVTMFTCFSKTPTLSPTGDCRPFSAQADGTILGEGFGFFVLKRLEDAERDGDQIYAVVRGLGSSSDGRSKSIYAPVAKGQANALSRAYQRAGYTADSVELVEAHGTGTRAGDLAEFEGLCLGFANEEKHQWCALGSVKSQIGHTKGAAGSAGLFKAVMALHHKVLPPTLKVDEVNPLFNIEQTPFYVNTQVRPWVRGSDHPRRASVSSFGFGGSDFHVTLEEYTKKGGKKPPKIRTTQGELCLFSATKQEALQAQLINLSLDEIPFDRFAYQTQQADHAQHAHRAAIFAKDPEDLQALAQKLASALAGEEVAKVGQSAIYRANAVEGQLAFLFPGQGSQYLNMTGELCISHSVVQQVWDQAADLPFAEGQALHQVVFPQPTFNQKDEKAQHARLVETRWAQPALGTASLAYYDLLTHMGLVPDCVAGHSFGELTALYAAGAVDRTTMMSMATTRGELMHEAALQHPGAMLAISHPLEEIQSLLTSWKLDITIANYNSPKQLILSGDLEAITALEKKLSAHKIRAKRLAVATGFHSAIVESASQQFSKTLKSFDFVKPNIPVYANFDGALYPSSVQKIKKQLATQISAPVRFTNMIQSMYEAGVRVFVEVGPNRVLSGLVRNILGEQATCISFSKSGSSEHEMLHIGLGQLFIAGIDMDYSALWEQARITPLAKKTDKRSFIVKLNGANYGKIYPLELDRSPIDCKIEQPSELSGASSMSSPISKNTTQSTSQTDVSRAAQPAEILQRIQQQLMESHMAHQQALNTSYQQFLQASQQAMAMFYQTPNSASTTTAPMMMPTPQVAPVAPVAPSATPLFDSPMSLSGPSAPPSFETPAPLADVALAPQVAAPSLSTPTSLASQMDTKDATVQNLAGLQTSQDPLEKLLLGITAEKTGYPVDMLKMDLELDSDFAIDSIKRIEILSELQSQLSELPELDMQEMTALNTLNQICEYLRILLPENSIYRATQPAQVATPKPSVAPVQNDVVETMAAAPSSVSDDSEQGSDIQARLLDIVADKTGYPVEMLSMEMELEADLGIDSIKRVEILAAAQEDIAELPDLDTNVLASLNTLQEIADYMNGSLTGTSGEVEKKN